MSQTEIIADKLSLSTAVSMQEQIPPGNSVAMLTPRITNFDNCLRESSSCSLIIKTKQKQTVTTMTRLNRIFDARRAHSVLQITPHSPPITRHIQDPNFADFHPVNEKEKTERRTRAMVESARTSLVNVANLFPPTNTRRRNRLPPAKHRGMQLTPVKTNLYK